MLGENIRKIRKAQKISINKLSKETGISLGYLSELENGKAKNPSLDKIKLIANALNCPVDELFSTSVTQEDVESWDNKIKPDYVDDSGTVYEFKEFKDPTEAMKFILNQKSVMAYGGFNVDNLSDQDKIDFANDLLQQLKLLSFKYK